MIDPITIAETTKKVAEAAEKVGGASQKLSKVESVAESESLTPLKAKSAELSGAAKDAPFVEKKPVELNDAPAKTDFVDKLPNDAQSDVAAQAKEVSFVDKMPDSPTEGDAFNKIDMPSDMRAKLQQEMAENKGLASLIHDNPKLNVERWLNTQNPIDQDLLKIVNGRTPVNGKYYAGNVFYFNPDLNHHLQEKLESSNGVVNCGQKDLKSLSFTREQLIELDKKYPDGVPFTKEGFPDFSKAAPKGPDGKPVTVTLDKFSGNELKDCIDAQNKWAAAGGNTEVAGYTWHHVQKAEGMADYMLRVPAEVHALVKHSGGASQSH